MKAKDPVVNNILLASVAFDDLIKPPIVHQIRWEMYTGRTIKLAMGDGSFGKSAIFAWAFNPYHVALGAIFSI